VDCRRKIIQSRLSWAEKEKKSNTSFEIVEQGRLLNNQFFLQIYFSFRYRLVFAFSFHNLRMGERREELLPEIVVFIGNGF